VDIVLADPMKSTRLVVVGEESIVRRGVTHLLTSEPEFEVLWQGESKDAIERTTKLRPDVVLLFAELTEPTCTQLTVSIRQAIPCSAIVILGRETHHAYVGALLAAGALGYVLLRAAPQELFTAVRAASRGRQHVDPELHDALFQILARRAELGTKVLSCREQEVLRMRAYGYTPKEIAFSLNISRKSIGTYCERAQGKLGLRTCSDIVRYALQTGMFNTELRTSVLGVQAQGRRYPTS